MAAEHQYFYEDEVFRINKKGNIEFGMVIETSELASSDENSDVEEGGRMKKDHIRVAWHPSGLEEVIPEKKVHLADRSLMPGDVVRRLIKGKDTQRGYCRDIKVLACVQVVGTKQVIVNVKSEHLTPLEEFATDIVACMDSWVGSIKTVHSKVVLRCPDGSRCITNNIEALGLEDFKERRDCECDLTDRRDEFYPGQILYGPLQVLEDAEWLHQTKEIKSQMVKSSKMVKVAVEEVRTDSVGIHWQCRAYSKEGAGLDKEQPKFVIQGDDLKKLRLLNVFEPCTLQVGDRNFYTLREGDTIITREQWRRLQRDTLVALSLSNGIKVASPKRMRSKTSGGDDAVRKSPLHGVSETISGQDVNMHTPEVTVTLANDDAEWDTEGTGSFSDTTSISSSNCSSISSQGKKKKGPALMTKVLKKKKLRRAKRKAPALPLVPGFRVVVETLSTSSIADVVWQDGSVELGIPSTQLYPIHHLDDQEFFPGDFVIENRDDSCMRVYGVVQSVDHAGRTATIKWFKTYTSQEEPQPAQLGENEVSVYDLKDHPDFQYRPGTVVIRVANFEGEDANCSAGQVLDNYPEGMVRVWWVDDHVSMCWPQDLYKVGEYDSDEGELWDDASSDGSWETESEDCFIADDVCLEEDVEKLLRPKLAANIEKARIAMSRLEEIFTQNPSLSTAGVMRQLLDVYKDCRYLDKLMGTSFFHESHFQGLLERVRERGRANVAQRVADQVSRLFHDSNHEYRTASTVGDPGSAPEDSGLSSTELSTKGSNGSSGNESYTSGAFFLSENLASLERRVTAASNQKTVDSDGVENTRTAGAMPNGHAESPEVAKSPTSPPVVVSNSHVCVKLCSLIKAQLVKAHAEVTRRFGGHQGQMTLSEAFKTHSPVEEAEEDKEAPTTVLASSEDAAGQPQPLLEKVKDGIMDVFNVIVRLKSNTVPNGDEVVEDVKEEAAVLPTTTSEETPAVREYGEGFSILDTAPSSHKFKLTMFQPTDPQNFFKTVRKEIKLLSTSLPRGIWVKGFEDRMDLYSVMVRGPENTPYEDGLFFFDFQLSAEYPKAPPLCHYISYCSDRLNPNLYEDGKVCVSLLGTWSGKGTEVWTATSNLLQVIVSIQGLILVSEPYFNEAGYEKQKGSQQGKENSRMYNEMAVLKLVQAQTKLILTPPPIFKEEIMTHFRHNAYKLIQRLECWLEISERYNSAHPITPTSPTSFRELHGQAISEALNAQLPEFPLIPASKGFCLTLRKSLVTFRETLASVGITGPS